MNKTTSRYTIADVARYAGVSKATVSRFLNHRDTLLSAEIARRVEAAIEELGYVPSPMAQALKRGRSRLIGLVVADIANPYSVAVLRGAELACRQAGYLVMLFNLGNESERESAGLRALSSYKVEGFILNTMGHDTGSLLEAATHGRPVVLVDRMHPGLNVDFISLDNAQAVGEGVRHLRESGYHDLLLVTEPLGAVSSRLERSQVFETLVHEQADVLRGSRYESPDDDDPGLVAALRALRRRAGKNRMPAVLAANVVITLRVIAAIEKLGWRLGAQVGLVGIDDARWAPYIGPGITTIAQPTDRIGERAAECLLQRIGGLSGPARAIRLPGTLMVRGSTTRQK
ncbi:substrate-binding domain-containing protein [Pusillimonas sp. TS35]|nr:substrate-binding domain-containing protein [Pusillimonas sp. TS35]